MTKDEIKNRISMALKDSILQQGFEIICKENEKLKAKYGCPNCVAFGNHCPHKVNGDPYFYDCYLTVEELEKENEELKILLKQCYQYHLHPEVSEYPYDKVEKFFNKGGCADIPHAVK